MHVTRTSVLAIALVGSGVACSATNSDPGFGQPVHSRTDSIPPAPPHANGPARAKPLEAKSEFDLGGCLSAAQVNGLDAAGIVVSCIAVIQQYDDNPEWAAAGCVAGGTLVPVAPEFGCPAGAALAIIVPAALSFDGENGLPGCPDVGSFASDAQSILSACNPFSSSGGGGGSGAGTQQLCQALLDSGCVPSPNAAALGCDPSQVSPPNGQVSCQLATDPASCCSDALQNPLNSAPVGCNPDASVNWCNLGGLEDTGGSSGAGSVCTTCTSAGYQDGECNQGWDCVNGCMIQDGCACNTCEYSGFAEGQCSQGYQCVNGCVVQNGCQDTSGSSGGSGASGGCAAGWDCTSNGYVEGQCYQGYECIGGCVVQDGCQDASGGSGGAASGCAAGWDCTSNGYVEGQCYEGYQCTGGCVVQNGCQ